MAKKITDPNTLIIKEIGTSYGKIINRLIRSLPTKKVAPTRAESGIAFLRLSPTLNVTILPMIKPINGIEPTVITEAALINEIQARPKVNTVW